MSEVQIRRLSSNESAAWPDTLAQSATFTALDSWSALVQQIYHYSIHRFEAFQNNDMVGILVLAHIRHPIFGNYLATSPFGSYGGFAFTSVEARNVLLDAACKLTSEVGANYAVIRFLDNGTPPSGWIQHPIYSTYLVDLPANADDLWKTFGSQHRKHTRQSLRKGFEIHFGHLELLDNTYEAMSRSMHELGSPYHSKKYLKTMATLLGKNWEFVLLCDSKGAIAGTSTVIYQGNMASTLHANILHKFRSDYAGECLYWSVLEHCCEKGMKVCDLGRSLNGSGNETFKMKWHPHKAPLSYWYYLPNGGEIPELNQKSPKFQLAIRAWKMLPAFLVRAIGPYLIGGIA